MRLKVNPRASVPDYRNGAMDTSYAAVPCLLLAGYCHS